MRRFSGDVAGDGVRTRVAAGPLEKESSAAEASSGDVDTSRRKGGLFGGLSWQSVLQSAMLLMVPLALPFCAAPTMPAFATDPVKVGTCLLQKCNLQLAQCLLNPRCAADIVCLNLCNNKPDEAECQVKCGNLFENEVVGKFNACAVSDKKCVDQKMDDGSYPDIPYEAFKHDFDTDLFKGRWYISAGLNPIFDIFDCQVHFFDAPSPGRIYGKLYWRITEPDGEFFTRDTVQRFVQQEDKGLLFNHDNEYLHYQDDWYIIDYEPDDFIAIYYRGRNDAWIGYGGAVVYSRDAAFPERHRERISNAFSKAGVDFQKFALTDNSCRPLDKSPSFLRAQYAKKLLLKAERNIQEELTSVRGYAANTLLREEKEFQAAVTNLETQIKDYENQFVFSAARELEELLRPLFSLGRGGKEELVNKL
ncbi:unnamed protein product [Vitrella brassicaformis CCMP3155]|uniref:VDE lipocalin domain-containing protein n=1 Tax=Vitrella brassicaformis (strain CCMP3155) TaxID=1169540 RepID=A0A0G4F7V7_VITBC|nr:unnamed protein product [Vitrella brassicaformis CCMP3155]|eukprot:CEM08622.1 unnamed protein product [Vitrella brassicaformis CCMP3155]